MRSRALAVAAFLALWLLGLAARLEHLQVTRHEHFVEKAANQQKRVLDLEPPRGTIYDARGRVLAVSVEVESVFADPSQVVDAAATADALSRVLDLDAGELAARLESDRDFVFVARKLDPPLAAAVAELSLPGIHFLRESKRYYPMRELAAQTLGFVGTDHVGLAGLEAQYDRAIAGRAGRRTVLRDAHRRTLLSPRLLQVEAEPGADLHLTLDAAVQHVVERELAAVVERHRAKSATAVFLDPATGAVLAIATAPGFDPNRFAEVSEDRWRIGAVMDSYEPGSTFKMVTAAAILEHGLLSPDDSLDCEMGAVTLAGVRIRDHHPFGELSVRQVLAKSSNVGVIKMGLLLGDTRLHDAIASFGFGRRTGVDLPGESPGIVRPVESWSALSKAYVSFGQEVSVTPLQMARALAAVANGGTLLEPRVVAAVGEAGPLQPQAAGRAVTPEVAGELGRMLAGVVAGGTGRRAAVPGYAVAGKTGTAQKVIDGRYSPNRFVASFMGFAPLSRPRLAGIVVVDEPRPAYHGGEVAAPAFAAMARQILLYWGVPPEASSDEPAGPPAEPLPPELPVVQLASAADPEPGVALDHALHSGLPDPPAPAAVDPSAALLTVTAPGGVATAPRPAAGRSRR